MRKLIKKVMAVTLTAAMVCSLGACATSDNKQKEKTSLLDPDNPVAVSVWNYYNGHQLVAFEDLVAEFNETVGLEKGIIVTAMSQGDLNNLADELISAVDGKVGAQEVPNMAAVYGETAYILQEKDKIIELDSYFTKEEIAEYVPSFIEEGRLVKDGPLLSFPALKSSEVFACNSTDWKKFEDACGITLDSVVSIEDMVKAAEKYYKWTDSLTPNKKEDGKALYGRDSVSNYIYIGAVQMGHPLFTIDKSGEVTMDLDKETFRKLWDNYYVPFIHGYFGANGNYRSDDAKTGYILCLTCSASAMAYFPTSVTLSDDNSHDIETEIRKPLNFKDAVSDVYVQQGAEYCVMNSTEQEQYASIEFLKWFTKAEQNTRFAVNAGYSPSKIESNKEEILQKAYEGDISGNKKEENMYRTLLVSSDIFVNEETYVGKPFEGSRDVRTFLEIALRDTASADRDAVVKRLKKGLTKEDAMKTYLSDGYFEEWYNDLVKEVESIAKQ